MCSSTTTPFLAEPTRHIAANDIEFSVQSSEDLETWDDIDPFGLNLAEASTDGTSQILVVRDNLPLSFGSRRFLRLRVSLPSLRQLGVSPARSAATGH
jgi:hypothetical protein